MKFNEKVRLLKEKVGNKNIGTKWKLNYWHKMENIVYLYSR